MPVKIILTILNKSKMKIIESMALLSACEKKYIYILYS